MDYVQLSERAEAGKKALKAKEENPELSDVSLEVLTDLALHNWKCMLSGEPVLNSGRPYIIFRFANTPDPDNEVEYGCIFGEFWHSGLEADLAIVKRL